MSTKRKSDQPAAPAKRGRKRTDLERDRDMSIIAGHYMKGLDCHQIADLMNGLPERRFTLSARQIGRDVSTAIKRWQKSMLDSIDKVKAAELAKINNLERIYWILFDGEPKETKEWEDPDDEEAFADLLAAISSSKKKLARDLRIEALKGVERCIDRRIKLLGADAPLRHDHSVCAETVNEMLHGLAKQMQTRMRALDGRVEADGEELIDAVFTAETEDLAD